MDELCVLRAKKEEIQMKCLIERSRSVAYGLKLDELQENLERVIQDKGNSISTAEYLLQLLDTQILNIYTLRNLMKDNDDFIRRMKRLCEKASAPISNERVYSSVTEKFLQDCRAAPWVRERKHLHSELEDEKSELEVYSRQIQIMSNKCEERSKLIEAHTNKPFVQFCLDLANFKKRMSLLESMMFKEQTINQEHRNKLARQRTSDVDDMNASIMSEFVESQDIDPNSFCVLDEAISFTQDPDREQVSAQQSSTFSNSLGYISASRNNSSSSTQSFEMQ